MTNYLTVEELAEKLRMSVGTCRNRISRGDEMPPSLKVGRRRLFPEDSLEDWIKAKAVGGSSYLDEWTHGDR